MTKELIRDSLERAGKTFIQFYIGAWMLAAGLLGTDLNVPNTAAFDLLFTLDNVKAGVVGVALSIATSVGSSRIGDSDNASLVN